jgi:hypothetical protein
VRDLKDIFSYLDRDRNGVIKSSELLNQMYDNNDEVGSSNVSAKSRSPRTKASSPRRSARNEIKIVLRKRADLVEEMMNQLKSISVDARYLLYSLYCCFCYLLFLFYFFIFYPVFFY